MTEKTESRPASESERQANVGRPIQLKKLGREVIVREISLETIIRCAQDLAYLMAVIDFSKDMDASVVMQVILKEPATMSSIRRFAAESTDTKVEDWEQAPLPDWLKFLRASKEVNDWEELQSLFTEAGLTEMFRRRTPTLPSTGSESTPLPTSESPTPQQG